MQDFYLRHTVYSRVTAGNAIEAGDFAITIQAELVEQLENIGVKVIEADMQKTWELVAQQEMQQS